MTRVLSTLEVQGLLLYPLGREGTWDVDCVMGSPALVLHIPVRGLGSMAGEAKDLR